MEVMESQTLLLTLLTVKVKMEPCSHVIWVEGWPLSATEMECAPSSALALPLTDREQSRRI